MVEWDLLFPPELFGCNLYLEQHRRGETDTVVYVHSGEIVAI